MVRFYPRHPRGWRLDGNLRPFVIHAVSIHATLAGGDKDWMLKISTPVRFYPRHPRGWRPPRRPRPVGKAQSFYPRHPRGWRPLNGRKSNEYGKFLSTPPSRVATGEPKPKVLALNQFLSTPPSRVATAEVTTTMYKFIVSIHATLAGGDPARCGTTCPA